MASGEFREARRLDTEQLVRPEVYMRLGMTKPFQRLFVERVDGEWGQARGLHSAPALLGAYVLIADRLAGCLADRGGDLGHAQGLRAGDLERATLMPALGENGESDLGDILDIDRRKPHVLERQQQQAFCGDGGRLAQIDLHELARTQMRPGETGLLQI